MAEKFTRVFSLPTDLYAEGSPLIIAAGALLKDNTTGRILAQLKLKNLESKAVRAARVRLWPADAMGREAEAPVEYTYLDLEAARGKDFGTKNPIPLPDASTRSFRAEVTEAAFADGSVWTGAEDKAWEPVPTGKTLEEELRDPELVKQLRLTRGQDCRYFPLRDRDIWRCACGEPVRGQTCPVCGKSCFETNFQALTEARDRRVAAEQASRQAAEKAAREQAEAAAQLAREKKGKRRRLAKRLTAVILPLAVLIAAAILLGLPGLSAMRAKKAAEAGDYRTAIAAYQEAAEHSVFNLFFHADEKAESLVPALHYREGEEALGEERYLDAVACFEAAGDYEDAKERITAAQPDVVRELLGKGGIAEALVRLERIEDTEENAGLLNELRLRLALAYAEAGDTKESREILKAVKMDEEDAAQQELLNQTRYQIAMTYREQGKTSDAINEFKQIPGYRDAEHQIQLCRIDVVEYYAAKDDTALLLKSMEAVEVSGLTAEEKERYQTILYGAAEKQEREENYADAFPLFRASEKGDYARRMYACNDKYIATAHEIPGSYYCEDKKLEIKEIYGRYHDGVVTFTVNYHSDFDFRWRFYTWADSASELFGERTRYGSSFTFDVPYAKMSDPGLEYLGINIWDSRNGSLSSSATFYSSDVKRLKVDLYGNDIP